MRFGLDDSGPVAEPRSRPLPIGILDKTDEPLEYSSALPVELLNTTLAQLNTLQLLAHKQNDQKRRDRLSSIVESGRVRNSQISTAIDNQILLERQSLDNEVQRIIEHQAKLLREAEERRQAELERKRQQEELERQEEERRKKEAEEAARKQREADERAAEEKRVQAEAEKAEAQRKLKEKLRQAKEEAARRANGLTNMADVEKNVVKYKQDIEDIKKSVVAPMSTNAALKKNVGVVKRKLNVKFGQLSMSRRQLESVSRDAIELAKYTVKDPLAYNWILNFIAKAIVAQAEAEVTVKPSAAVPLALLALNLLDGLDGLYYYLCARFAKKCSFILGYTCAIDTEEGRVRMGWKRSDGKWESEVKYEERVGGICSVWAVMSRLSNSDKYPFFSMASEWTFMARMLNTNKALLSNVHYVVFCNWWEAAAEQLVSKYGKQALKGLLLAVGGWSQLGKTKSFPAATRLIILGDDFRSTRSFNLLKDMEY